jgi:antitoxin MazE
VTIATIGRWGKTLAVRLPKEIAERARLKEGEQVEIEEVDGEIRLQKRVAPADLDALFAGRTAEQWRELYRDAYDWGDDVGRERLP